MTTTKAEQVYKLLANELLTKFAVRTQDGHDQTLVVKSAQTTEGYLLLEIDTSRIPRQYKISDLDNPTILRHLSAVCHYPVTKLNHSGLTYVVRLKPRERRPELPKRALLAMDHRPPGHLMVPLGVGHNGPAWAPLPELGHTLATGMSGSGKSSLFQSFLTATLPLEGPDKIGLALIDPKSVELAYWRNAPQVMGYADNGDDATELLRQVESEMYRRGDLLREKLCRDLASFNKRTQDPLPYMIVAVDELFDVVAATGDPHRSDFSLGLARIASKGRALGVFLWLAAQHARFDTLDRRVMANMATKAVFRVVDSKAAQMVEVPGAERLPDIPGRYILAQGEGRQILQAYYVDDRTLRGMSRALSPQGPREIGAPTAKVSSLSSDEQRLAKLLVEEFDGVFVVNKVYQRGNATEDGFSRRWLLTTSNEWLRKGYLAEDRTDPKHPRRVVTDELRAELAW